jgi:DNA repair protein RecO (recombination protein O)
MRVQSQPAYLLHARPFRETSLVIEVFSRQYGRCGLLARGVRNPKARKRALLMPFQPLLLDWSGKGELPLLTGVETTGEARELMSTYRFAAYYLNELLLRMLARLDAHEDLFDSYTEILDELYRREPVQQALRRFEKRLLSETGYGLILDHEAGMSKPVEAEYTYLYIPEHGPVRLHGSEEMRAGKHQGIEISGRSLLDFYQERFSSRKSLNECRRLSRYLLSQQFPGRPLHSRDVFHQVLSSLA